MSRLSKAGGKMMSKKKIPDPITAAMVCSDAACALLLLLANFSNQIRMQIIKNNSSLTGTIMTNCENEIKRLEKGFAMNFSWGYAIQSNQVHVVFFQAFSFSVCRNRRGSKRTRRIRGASRVVEERKVQLPYAHPMRVIVTTHYLFRGREEVGESM